MWVGVLMVLLLYMFAVLCTTGIGGDDSVQDIEFTTSQFDRVEKSMLTLMQIMTLDAWTDLVRAYAGRSFFAMFIIIFFMVLSAMILMNLLSAIFVDKLMQLTNDAEKLALEKAEAEKIVLQAKLKKVFAAFDDDGDGTLTVEELNYGLQELDTDNSGSLEPNEIAEAFEQAGLGQEDMDELIQYLQVSRSTIHVYA